MGDRSSLKPDDFSLAKGGPLFEVLVRTRLMRPDLSPAGRRAVFLVLITWFPLLLLSAWQGLAIGGEVKIPFLFDFTAAVRFLVCVPLLIIAEIVIDSRSREVIGYFFTSELVEEKELPSFAGAIRKIIRLRESVLAEGVMVGLIIAAAVFQRREFSGGSSTWQILVSSVGAERTLAGWWYVLASLPVFQFLLLRWLWRIAIWYWFLWRTSRLDLRLIPTHPDMAGGLGILGIAQAKFGIIIFAGSAVIAADIGRDIIFGEASLFDYQMFIIGYVLLILILFLSPLLVFTPRLFAVKRKGLLEYGTLATRYVRDFQRKWMRGEIPHGEALLGSADIQSLADLQNSFETVRKMRPIPIDLNTLISLAGPAVAPLLPLLLTVLPMEEIIGKVFSLLF
jgi:hypothetical protein